MHDRLLVAVLVAMAATLLVLLAILGADMSRTPGAQPAPTVEPPAQDPTSTTEPTPTTTTTTTEAPVITIDSTAYCETGIMADGRRVHDGAVSSHQLPRGSRWLVIDGPHAGRTLTVEDTGPGATFDIWHPSCADARQYGRRTVHITAVAP